MPSSSDTIGSKPKLNDENITEIKERIRELDKKISSGTSTGISDEPAYEEREQLRKRLKGEAKANEDSYYLDDQTQYDGTPYQSQTHYVDYEIQGHFNPSNGDWSMVTCNHCGQKMTYDQAMAHMLNTHDTTTNAEQSGYTNFGGGNEENNWSGTFMKSLGESKKVNKRRRGF